MVTDPLGLKPLLQCDYHFDPGKQMLYCLGREELKPSLEAHFTNFLAATKQL